jgi:biopolymer transport protein ExbD
VLIENVQRKRTGLNMAPLIDVVFLLLIFFLLTSALASSDQLDIQLPESEAAGLDPDKDAIILEVNREGTMAIGAMRVTDESLERDLVRAAGGPEASKERILLVKSAGDAHSQEVMDVIEAARKVQLKKVTIATIPR